MIELKKFPHTFNTEKKCYLKKIFLKEIHSREIDFIQEVDHLGIEALD